MNEHEQAWATDRGRFIADVETAAAAHRAPTRDHGYPLGPLGQQFAALTYSLLDADTVTDVLDQIVAAAQLLFPAVDVASVTVRSKDGALHTTAESDPLATVLDELQHEFDEGPFFDASRPDGPAIAVCADLRDNPFMVQLSSMAADLGVRSVLSTAIIAVPRSEAARGALNLYSRSAHGLADVDRDQVLLLATHAALALARTDVAERAQLQEVNLRRAIDSRDVIGQAKGIIMTRRGVAADQAFDLLRRASQDLNVGLAELAETLATRHTEIDLP